MERNIDCRTCKHSRLDNFRAVRYCTITGDFCHGANDCSGNPEAERGNRYIPDKGEETCPGMEMVLGLRERVSE